MTKIAIDIVLLPSDSIMKDIISLINYSAESVIKLNTNNCLPHISLAMAAVDQSSVSAISKSLDHLARKVEAPSIRMTKTKTIIIELSKLHLASFELIQPFIDDDEVNTRMFISPPDVADISTTWVKHYFDNLDNFNPHITLGEGIVTQLEETVEFTANRLALCHLGSYCTCRKVLFETTLGPV